jgi:hypothetical protein
MTGIGILRTDSFAIFAPAPLTLCNRVHAYLRETPDIVNVRPMTKKGGLLARPSAFWKTASPFSRRGR